MRAPRRPVEDALFESEPEFPDWAVRFIETLTPGERAVLELDPELPTPEQAAFLGTTTTALRQRRTRLRAKALRAFPPEVLDRVRELLDGRESWKGWQFPMDVTSPDSKG